MKTKLYITVASLFLVTLFLCSGSSFAFVFGVNPSNTGNEVVEIDPFSGSVNKSFSAPDTISPNDTEIGLAGWSNNQLFYTNANQGNNLIYTMDPSDGSVIGSYTVSGGWEIDGLGYYRNNAGSWIYTSGCTVNDMHRYNAQDGANPIYYWGTNEYPQAVAGDYAGRILTYAQVNSQWGIWDVDPLTNTAETWFGNSPSNSIVGMAYDGSYLYLSDTDNKLFTLDNSGNQVSSLDLGYTLYGLASSEGTGPAPVPEPATMVLLGTGLLGLAAIGRRKLINKS